MIWGSDDPNYYNYCHTNLLSSIFTGFGCCKQEKLGEEDIMTKGEWRGFYALQVLRLLSLLTTMAGLGIYFFIYMRKAFIYYSFWALLFTFFAFLFLLIGFGK